MLLLRKLLEMLKSTNFILFILFFCSQAVIAQPFDTVRIDQGNGWQAIQILGNKTIIAEGTMKNNLKEGTWNTYWETGFPQEITTYRNGKKNGLYVKTGADGFVEQMATYSNDELNGPYRAYNKGAFILEEIYYKNGIKNGSYTKWYINGIRKCLR